MSQTKSAPRSRAGLRSHDAFTVRRCQIVLASAEGQKPSQIATTLHCAPQTVRNVSTRLTRVAWRVCSMGRTYRSGSSPC